MTRIISLLVEIAGLLRMTRPAKDVMDHKELSAYLGFSSNHLYSLVSLYQIPFCEIGGSRRYRKEAVDQWLKSREVKSPEGHRALLDGRRRVA